MVRAFYNYIASVYSLTNQKIRGSLVQKKILKYENINIAFWKINQTNYSDTPIATQTDRNKYEVNLMPQYIVNIGDIFVINSEEYKVDDVIKHNKSNGVIDNWQVFISKTTKENEE